MSKSAIPITPTGNPGLDRTLAAVKKNLDEITGSDRKGSSLQPLPSGASLAQVIAQLNAILERIQ